LASSASSAASAVGAALADAHPLEALAAVGRLGEGLGRHRADAGRGPRHRRPDREPVRLHRDAEVAGGGIARDDRVGVRRAARLDRGAARRRMAAC
jgi:hypothetical protein